MAPEAEGVGDVMRELDGKSLIHTDFILVSGNVISNMKLDAVLQEHMRRKTVHKVDSIMTMVMKYASPRHRTRALGEGALVAIDPLTGECLQYQVQRPVLGKGMTPRLTVDLEILRRHPTLQLHNDLLDCQIDICSVEVPALFTENFDYQDIRTDFVHGILTSDLLKKSIHVHVLGDEYAARVKSPQLYDAISKDMISRWTFPMVPDSNVHDTDEYEYYRGHVYKGRSVVLARSAIVEERVVLGSGTSVGEHTTIRDSTLGKNCKVGRNVQISNAYVWDNVQIGDNCILKNCIVASGAVLKNNVTLTRGCIVSFGVTLGPEVVLQPFTKLTKVLPDPETTEYEVDLEGIKIDSEIVGKQGDAYVWNAIQWGDADYDDEPLPLLFEIGFDPELDSHHMHSQHTPYHRRTASGSMDTLSEVSSNADLGSQSGQLSENEADELQKHLSEVVETLRRAIRESHTAENAILELNALKMACNITFHDLRVGIVAALVESVDIKTAQKSVEELLERWAECLKKFTMSPADQEDILWITLQFCLDKPKYISVFVHVVMGYYQEDVVEEDTIFDFYESDKWARVSEEGKKVRTSMRPLIEWLENAESESEEESEDED